MCQLWWQRLGRLASDVPTAIGFANGHNALHLGPGARLQVLPVPVVQFEGDEVVAAEDPLVAAPNLRAAPAILIEDESINRER